MAKPIMDDCKIMQDIWQAPDRTPVKDLQNVRLALAYEDFVAWARQRKLEPLQWHFVRLSLFACL